MAAGIDRHGHNRRLAVLHREEGEDIIAGHAGAADEAEEAARTLRRPIAEGEQVVRAVIGQLDGQDRARAGEVEAAAEQRSGGRDALADQLPDTAANRTDLVREHHEEIRAVGRDGDRVVARQGVVINGDRAARKPGSGEQLAIDDGAVIAATAPRHQHLGAAGREIEVPRLGGDAAEGKGVTGQGAGRGHPLAVNDAAAGPAHEVAAAGIHHLHVPVLRSRSGDREIRTRERAARIDKLAMDTTRLARPNHEIVGTVVSDLGHESVGHEGDPRTDIAAGGRDQLRHEARGRIAVALDRHEVVRAVIRGRDAKRAGVNVDREHRHEFALDNAGPIANERHPVRVGHRHAIGAGIGVLEVSEIQRGAGRAVDGHEILVPLVGERAVTGGDHAERGAAPGRHGLALRLGRDARGRRAEIIEVGLPGRNGQVAGAAGQGHAESAAVIHAPGEGAGTDVDVLQHDPVVTVGRTIGIVPGSQVLGRAVETDAQGCIGGAIRD